MSWLREALDRRATKAAAQPPVQAGPLWPITSATVSLNADLFVDRILGMGPSELWRTQPYLRTVVSFVARNIAQLGLHTFRRESDTDRQRLNDHALARLLRRPNPGTTCYELLYQLVSDLMLYDRAYWYIGQDSSTLSGYTLTRLPPPWVIGSAGGDLFSADVFQVQPTVSHRSPAIVDIPAKDVLYFHGWHPDRPTLGCSPVEALKQILAEQIHAATYRDQVWRRGGRASSVLRRPPEAPDWSPEAKARFRKEWAQQWSGDAGTRAGGTPILEDGMTIERLGFSAHEDEFIEAAKLAINIVASVYHVNPTMIGILDNANYSNVREFRRMLYGDTLGPVLAQIEDRLNTFLVPRLPDPDNVYVEFNIGEKLQGSFEEQAAALQTSVGRPWMTADEARAKLNMPSLGGDAERLVTPLNVLIGGQASPTDSGSQNRTTASSSGARVKARAPEQHDAKHEQVLREFFAQQGQVVRSRLGAKADADWWDEERWNGELAARLYALSVDVSKHVAASTLDSLGFSPDQYDVDQTLAWLRTVAESSAVNINAATRAQIDEALASDDPAQGVRDVFDAAVGVRAAEIATVAVTRSSSFGTVESAKQVARERARKTWITGAKPRESHAAMDGISVAIDEPFPNGLMWPGDGGDPDEVAGCNCGVEVSVA